MKVVLPCGKRLTTPLPRVFTIRELKSFYETYRRIGRELFGMSSLWLADDHLVYVKGTGFLMPFLEEYKRFRLSDIEARLIAAAGSAVFLRVHRRALVNLRRVLRLEDQPTGGYLAHTDGGEAAPVSRKVARELRRQWGL